MTPVEKKEAKRLYDIEYRKKNAIKLSMKAKLKYENIPLEDKKIINKLKYASLNKETKKKSDQEYATKNRDKLNIKKKNWAKANIEKVKKAKTKHFMNKLHKDPLFKFKHNLGCGIRQAFKRKGYTKNSKTFIILGCSFDKFKTYIESKFESWMNWGNYGKSNNKKLIPNTSWDIDHIEPLSNAKTEEDVIRLNHYTNLQPLCSYHNQLIKKDIF